MQKKRDDFRLGIAVLMILALFITVVIYIGSGWQRERRVPFVVRFPHTLNLPILEEGANILGFGQIIGKVTDVDHAQDPPPEAPEGEPMLYLELRGEVIESMGLRRDCKIVAEGPVLGGKGHLRIANRGVSSELVDPDVPVYGGASGFSAALELLSNELDAGKPSSLMSEIKLQLDPDQVASLISKIHVSMDDLNAITRSVAMQVDAREKDALMAKLGGILDNLNATTAQLRDQLTLGAEGVLLAKVHTALDSLNRGLGEASDLLQGAHPHIDNALLSVERLAATVDRDIATPIAQELDVDNPEGLLVDVHQAFDKLNTSLADMNVITDTGRKLLVLNEGRLNRLLANVTETSDHLKAAAKDLRRNPWRLLYRPSPEETKEANILDAARAFSEAAGRLDDSAGQLRALLDSGDGEITVADPELVELRQRLVETFEKFTEAEQSLWKQLGTP